MDPIFWMLHQVPWCVDKCLGRQLWPGPSRHSVPGWTGALWLDPVDLPPQECSARCRCLHWRCPWEDQPAPTTFLYPEEGGVHQEGGVKPCLLPGPTSELYQTLILCRSGAHTNSTHVVCLDTLVSTATTFCMHFCYLYVMSPGYNL